ncbi:MAG: acetoin dehydrogenase, partial [Bacteroidota bacterium]|nr:acetoin dehydrogenase [Bacteroidota bacterium]
MSLAKRGCHLALIDSNDSGLTETHQLIADGKVRISLHELDV